MKKILIFLVWVVVIGLTLVNISPSLPLLNRVTGGILIAFTFFFMLLSRKTILFKGIFSIEMRLFAFFIGSSLVFGLLIASDQEALLSKIQTLVQIWLLCAAVIVSVVSNKSVKHVFYILYFSPILLSLYIISAEGWDALFNFSQTRLSVEAMNPNAFGGFMLNGIFASLYLLYMQKKLLAKILLLIPLPVFIIGLLQSGSRKSIIAAVIAVLAWLLLCYLPTLQGKRLFAWIRTLAIAGMVVIFGLYLVNEILPESVSGTRLSELFNDPGATTAKRLQLYQESFTTFAAHPIFGIGLANFASYSSLQYYAHSEYMEILADTGLVGTLIYFPIYLLLWLKMSKITREFAHQVRVRYTANIFRVGILTILFLGFGRPNYDNIPVWLIFSSFIGYNAAVHWYFSARHNNQTAADLSPSNLAPAR